MKWKKKVAKADKPDSSTTGKKGEKTERIDGKTEKETVTKGGEKTTNDQNNAKV